MKLEEFCGANIPKYAILSHTWGDDELSFQDFEQPHASTEPGYHKIQDTAVLVRETTPSVNYIWIDTCCIDKSNSSELSEAINSMFRWYKESVVCYAYLSDLSPEVSTEHGMPGCRWFTRGWTLQEPIAPKTLIFYDKSWSKRGSKRSLGSLIRNITGIDEEILCESGSLPTCSVAMKMSWASGRNTTRIEDMAYCLLGIFDINMPLLYGEGHKAFLRLQEAIAEQTDDMSLFAWRPLRDNENGRGIFARTPEEFKWCRHVRSLSWAAEIADLTMTNKGLRIATRLIEYPHVDRDNTATKLPLFRYLLDLNCYSPGTGSIGIFLKMCGPDRFLRDTTKDGGLWLADVRPSHTSLKRMPTRGITIPRDHLSLNSLPAFGLHLQVENGLRIIKAVPSSLWDPSFQFFFPVMHSTNVTGGSKALVLRPNGATDSNDDFVVVFSSILLPIAGLYNFYAFPRTHPKADDVLGNIPFLGEFDLQGPTLGFNPIPRRQSDPPLPFFRSLGCAANESNRSRGVGTTMLPGGEVQVMWHAQEIKELELPQNTEIICVRIAYTKREELSPAEESEEVPRGTIFGIPSQDEINSWCDVNHPRP